MAGPRRILAALLCAVAPLGAAQPDLEAKVKAAYIYHLIQYVSRPDASPEAEGAPIRLGILGTDPVATCLEELSGRTILGRPLLMERVPRDSRRLATFHLLYLARSEQAAMAGCLQQVQGRPVLTLSDIERFACRGGMVGFKREDGRIRLEISLPTVRQSNLRLGARLIEVARTAP